MPRRTITFLDNAYYHVFNRGIENLKLFQDDQDIAAFQNSLAYYLVTFHEKPVDILARTGLTFNNTFNGRVTLFAYALLPGSFHLLIHQADHNAIVKFMQRVGTAYSMYYNKKYTRRGTIFEGRFKTKHIDTDDYLLESTKYIHRLGLPAQITGNGSEPSNLGVAPDSPNPSSDSSPSDPNIQNTNPNIQNSPLSSLRFILKSSQNEVPSNPNPTSQTALETKSLIGATTSYQRYLDQTNPGFSPVSYIDQAVNPTKPLQHFTATKPGLSYHDYVEASPNVEWYLGLLSWLQ